MWLLRARLGGDGHYSQALYAVRVPNEVEQPAVAVAGAQWRAPRGRTIRVGVRKWEEWVGVRDGPLADYGRRLTKGCHQRVLGQLPRREQMVQGGPTVEIKVTGQDDGRAMNVRRRRQRARPPLSLSHVARPLQLQATKQRLDLAESLRRLLGSRFEMHICDIKWLSACNGSIHGLQHGDEHARTRLGAHAAQCPSPVQHRICNRVLAVRLLEHRIITQVGQLTKKLAP
mmetsp:Transcript_29744/g.96055  ORF Transcript_29744/g.96055 Transcript_29744/m.96055 type:complete len:229 (-) Transcript_29744:291-977(-)|eukprot:scaffold23500_cov117-Isochrysis_galbana.AAC.6